MSRKLFMFVRESNASFALILKICANISLNVCLFRNIWKLCCCFFCAPYVYWILGRGNKGSGIVVPVMALFWNGNASNVIIIYVCGWIVEQHENQKRNKIEKKKPEWKDFFYSIQCASKKHTEPTLSNINVFYMIHKLNGSNKKSSDTEKERIKNQEILFIMKNKGFSLFFTHFHRRMFTKTECELANVFYKIE